MAVCHTCLSYHWFLLLAKCQFVVVVVLVVVVVVVVVKTLAYDCLYTLALVVAL